MMKPLRDRDPFKIGIAVFCIIGLMGLGVVALSKASFGTRDRHVMLTQSAGLRAGELVEVHGVVSGKVKKVALDGKQVNVTFALTSGVKLGSTSRAAVKVATLLGTHYLEVDPAGVGDEDTIPVDRSSVPYNLQDVINQGSESLGQLDPQALAKALTAMADTLDAAAPDVGPALQGIADLSSVITKRGAQTTQLLAAVKSVSDELNQSTPNLVELMKDTNLVVAEITSRRQAIHDLFVQVTQLANSLNTVIDKTKGDLQPALKSINNVLDHLNSQDKLLTHTLDVLAPAVRYVANATGNGPWADLNFDPPGLTPDSLH
jgi:phospholipid/cholesterol/gamma-HCH transport system substrate-binding protein